MSQDILNRMTNGTENNFQFDPINLDETVILLHDFNTKDHILIHVDTVSHGLNEV
jgi:hypothetical protein